MSPRSYLSIVLICGAVSACDLAGIVSSAPDKSRNLEADQAETLLTVETTGGRAGLYRLMTVDTAGRLTLTDSFLNGASWTVRLSESQLDSLVNLFVENDFSELNAAYVDAQAVADASYYSITFNRNQQSITVMTDGFAAPENLNRILQGLIALQRRVAERTLSLQLDVSKDAISAGEKVELTLSVTNVSGANMVLDFNSGQIFDFYAVRSDHSRGLALPSDYVWNWAHDQFFVEMIQTIELKAGETRTYRITWDGQDNHDKQLIGDYLIGAELVSIPGGRPGHQPLTIRAN